ncbi:hypothetical protein EYF80_051918 [Liparis tanakae]|uniref:Uncharacterized protein n=1 Tax=Liparis tanakae TaxID=230148 RepID=A0A4Z2FAL7_9TELE|nr:hypothetical protein EYF80_051918 [Liparis tanakae]
MTLIRLLTESKFSTWSSSNLKEGQTFMKKAAPARQKESLNASPKACGVLCDANGVFECVHLFIPSTNATSSGEEEM